MATMQPDKRRYGLICTVQRSPTVYRLTIDGELWSEVEWSPSRQMWCIQDAAGHCLTHVEHIVGQDRDVQTAIRLARRMIVDGRMPTPEEARARLEAKLGNPKPEHRHLGEPFVMVPEPVQISPPRDDSKR
jgi:hypothetical protein